MDWIDFKEKPPELFTMVIVAKSYLHSVFDSNTGTYDTDKSFWTEPVIMADWIIHDEGELRWDKGGKALYWMPLPELPSCAS